MTPSIRYPANPVTPHGAYHILRDRTPMVTLTAYDESIVMHLMGGLAIADRTTPERVELKDIKGLVPPWQTIDQKGATQDGVTFVDALYDPIEVEATVVAHGRNPAYCRKVVNHLQGSIDAKQTSRLAWFTHEMGYWWANVRWFKTPVDATAVRKRETKSLRLRADTGFWQSYPDVAQFRFDYAATGDDNFDEDDPDSLDTDLWDVAYVGGSGLIYTDEGEVKSTLNNRHAIARRKVYVSPTDNQVIELQIGRLATWFYDPDTAIEIWGRMANSGTPGQDGVCVEIYRHRLVVASYDGGVRTVLRERIIPLIIPPLPGEKFTLIVGKPTGILADTRRFTVLRNGAPIMSFKETGTASQIGSGFRSVGFGIKTDSSSVPPGIRAFNAGGNAVETQSGFLRRINAGDQEAWDRFTCIGPGTFRFGNGPGSTDMVEFGPLKAGQVAQVRTDPRKYGVKDLTPPSPSTPIPVADADSFTDGIKDFLSFITFNNVTHILDVFQSIFGLLGGGSAAVPPQGNLYALLKGRFSRPIPAKSPGKPAVPYYVKVEISGGDAESAIIASLTPLRRYPY